jgi:hypothetical protein
VKNIEDLLARAALTSSQPVTLTIEASRLEVDGMKPLIIVGVVGQVDGRRLERRVVVQAEDGGAKLLDRVTGVIAEMADDHTESIKEREAAVGEVAARNERDRAAAQAAEAARRADPLPAEEAVP